jgi:hypothetical protein
MDLNEILRQMTGAAQQRKSAIAAQAQQMEQDTARMENAMTVNVQGAQQVAQEAARIAEQEAIVAAKQQEAVVKGSVILGLDPDDLENELVKSMGEYDFAEAERKRVRQEYSQLSSVSLLDNPLQFIAAQLKLPQIAARNNDLVDMRDAAARNIQTRQALLGQHRSTVVANTVDQVRQINVDKAANAQRAAEVQLQEATMANASKIAGQKLQIFNLTDKMFDVDATALSQKLQIGQYMMSMEERKEARAARIEQSRLMMEERQEAREDRKLLRDQRMAAQAQEQQQTQELNLQFQRLSQFLGLQTPMTVESLRNLANPKRKQAWLDAATTGTVGSDILSAIDFVNQNSNVNVLSTFNPGVGMFARETYKTIESYATGEARAATARGEKIKPDEIVSRGQAAYLNEVIASANDPKSGNSLTSSRWDTIFNMYKAQHKVILDERASTPAHPLANNPYADVVKNVVDTSQSSPGPNLTSEDEQRALRMMAERVKRKEIAPDAAADAIASYYTYSMGKNRDLFQYDLFNVPPQTRYFGQIGAVSLFGKPKEVDLSNAAQVKRALIEQVRLQTPDLQVPALTMPSLRAAEISVLGTQSLINSITGKTGE